jgi:hypothetical protein
MTEHFFCLHQGHLDSERLDAVFRERDIDAWHVNYTEPSGKRYGWFACRNRGNPFNQWTAREAMDAIDAAGGLDAFRPDEEDVDQ